MSLKAQAPARKLHVPQQAAGQLAGTPDRSNALPELPADLFMTFEGLTREERLPSSPVLSPLWNGTW